MSTSTKLPSPDECEVRLASDEERFEMYDRCRVEFAPKIESKPFAELMRKKVQAPYSQDGRSRSWVLVKKGDPNSPLYAHAETLHRDGWAKDEDGMRDASIFGVVFVVTPPDFRRHGYARRLMRLIHYLFAPTQNVGEYPTNWAPLPPRPKENFPPADLSYLSSVAPRGFYEDCLIGPDEDKRVGWASRAIENAELVWEMTNLPGEDGGEKKEYQVVYHKDIQGLAEEIAEAHKAILEKTEVKPGETVCRLIPSSPKGILTYTDLHWATGGSVRQQPYGPDEPLGVRFAAPGEPFSSTQPLVLFMPEAWKSDEVLITMLLNIDEKVLPAAIKAVQEVAVGAKGKPCTRARIWGIDKGEHIADTLIALGAKLSYRNETHDMPAGVAWYGPKGTTGRMQGMEAWAWL